MLVIALPDNDAERDAIRARARTLSAIADARLLPIYGQGEDNGLLWLATRKLEGHSLGEMKRIEPELAARLGAQLARQLAALVDADVAPATIAPEDVLVEGEGTQRRAWLLLDPARPTAESAAAATGALVRMLDERAGRTVLEDAPSDPAALADAFASLGPRSHRRRRLALALALAALIAAGLGVGLALTVGSRSRNRGTAPAPIARVVARIPLNAVPWSVASGENIWVATANGALIHVDPKTNRVVGAPRQLLAKQSYPSLYSHGGTLYLGSEDLIRLDARTGRVLARTHVRGKKAFVASLFSRGDSLWATVSGAVEPAGEPRADDPLSLRELGRSKRFGRAPALALVTKNQALAVNQADGTLTKISTSGGRQRRIRVSAGLQATTAAFSAGRLWIPGGLDRAVTEVDPVRMVVERAVHLGGWADYATTGAGSVWVVTERPSRIYQSIRRQHASSGTASGSGEGQRPCLRRRFPVGGRPKRKGVDPPETASPAPAAKPTLNDDTLRRAPFQLESGSWTGTSSRTSRSKCPTQAGSSTRSTPMRALGRVTIPDYGTSFSILKTPAALFDASGRLTHIKTAGQFIAVLRRNPPLERQCRLAHEHRRRGGAQGQCSGGPEAPVPRALPRAALRPRLSDQAGDVHTRRRTDRRADADGAPREADHVRSEPWWSS